MNNEKTYHGSIDLSVRNNSHTIMHDLILESCGGRSARILDVGCAGGYFGEALKNQGFEVWGVEISPEQAEDAKKRLQSVYRGDIESFMRSDAARGALFDYIVFGDVLEHLERPVDVLRSCAEFLAPGGAVLASIPNVAHLAVRLMLLEGRWEYAPFGIMDDTHLRFFTRRSVIELFTQAGYVIRAMDAVRLPVELTGIEVAPALREAVRPLVTDNDQDVFQHVVMAGKPAGKESPGCNTRFLNTASLNVLCLLPFADWSVGDIRFRHPLQRWQQRYGGEVKIRSIYEYAPDELDWADVVILQRESSPLVLHLISTVKRLGKAVILDMDDLLTEVPPFLSVHAHAQRNKNLLEEALRQVDAVTVTTAKLQKRMTAYNDNVRIVPNCASSRHAPASQDAGGDAPVTLIVASSDTVRVEFIVPALHRLQANPELNIRIVGIGPPGDFLAESGVKVERHDNMTYDRFKEFLASMDNSIGVIPLDDSEFSSCKSAIKFVDYALAGIPSVCSAVTPYADVVEHGVTGILVDNDAEAWVEGVKSLLPPENRRRITAAARAYCQEAFCLDRAAEMWQEAFAEMPSSAGPAEDPGPPERRPFHVARVLARNSVRPWAYRFVFRLVFEEGRTFIRNVVSRLKIHAMMAR